MKSKKKPQQANETDLDLSLVNEPVIAYVNVARTIDMRMMSLLNTSKSTIAFHDETDLIDVIRQGDSKKSLDYLITQIGYTITDIAEVLHVSDRNLRRYTASEKLNTEQSERLIEIARLYAKGEDVFGSIKAFNHWMDANILALGNKTPKSYLDTSLGIQLLHKELGRIEHGVFA
jgi:putative toxin-antitoxin system antitoxin component (TIGR02293 family)